MKLYIAESHKENGYFITAQKDGKKGTLQKYHDIFVVYDENFEKWHFKTQRSFTAKRDAKSWAEEEYANFNEKRQTATIASVKGRTNFAAFVEKHYRDYLENDRQLKGAKQECDGQEKQERGLSFLL